jgi:hypothetical protein
MRARSTLLFVIGVLIGSWSQSPLAAQSILREMSAAHDGVWADDSRPARLILLKHFPLRTSRSTIETALTREGFDCAMRFGGHERRLNCQILESARFFSVRRHWILDFHFDDSDRLSRAKAAIWNIFF